MPKTARHTGLHLTLILALVFAPAAGVWAATQVAVPDAPMGHCEQMAAKAAQHHHQMTTAKEDCCQGDAHCGVCQVCPIHTAKYDSAFGYHFGAQPCPHSLSNLQVVSPQGENPRLDIRPPIYRL